MAFRVIHCTQPGHCYGTSELLEEAQVHQTLRRTESDQICAQSAHHCSPNPTAVCKKTQVTHHTAKLPRHLKNDEISRTERTHDEFRVRYTLLVAALCSSYESHRQLGMSTFHELVS
jgi:hypothetical protein